MGDLFVEIKRRRGPVWRTDRWLGGVLTHAVGSLVEVGPRIPLAPLRFSARQYGRNSRDLQGIGGCSPTSIAAGSTWFARTDGEQARRLHGEGARARRSTGGRFTCPPAPRRRAARACPRRRPCSPS